MRPLTKPHIGACEKCWRDANERMFHLGGSVTQHYQDLLREREKNPCRDSDQRGELAAKEEG
jgi:hypothetical protein